MMNQNQDQYNQEIKQDIDAKCKVNNINGDCEICNILIYKKDWTLVDYSKLPSRIYDLMIVIKNKYHDIFEILIEIPRITNRINKINTSQFETIVEEILDLYPLTSKECEKKMLRIDIYLNIHINSITINSHSNSESDSNECIGYRQKLINFIIFYIFTFAYF